MGAPRACNCFSAKTRAPSPGHVHFDTSFELARAAHARDRTAPFLSRILPPNRRNQARWSRGVFTRLFRLLYSPAKEQRRRRKRARRGLGHQILHVRLLPTGAGPQRASGWTLARALAAATPTLQIPPTKRLRRIRGLCARLLFAQRRVFSTAPPQPRVTLFRRPLLLRPTRALPSPPPFRQLFLRALQLYRAFSCACFLFSS